MTEKSKAPKAVVLLSGGLDSATVLAIAINQGFKVYALTFRYGQRHGAEVEAASNVAAAGGAVQHRIVDIAQDAFKGSALTGNGLVPKGRSDSEISSGVPVTYVPARNAIFLAYALGFAEVIGAADIFIGVNAVDFSGYPDCRPEFIEAFQRMANLATKAAVEDGRPINIHAPLIRLGKGQIIEQGLRLGVDFGLTFSCYDPDAFGQPCGECDACRLRRKGFKEALAVDPGAK